MHFFSVTKLPTILYILVGCKSDMRGRIYVVVDGSGKTNGVTMEQEHMLANQIGAVYLECSPKSGDGTEYMIKFIAKKEMAWDPGAEPGSNRICLVS